MSWVRAFRNVLAMFACMAFLIGTLIAASALCSAFGWYGVVPALLVAAIGFATLEWWVLG